MNVARSAKLRSLIVGPQRRTVKIPIWKVSDGDHKLPCTKTFRLIAFPSFSSREFYPPVTKSFPQSRSANTNPSRVTISPASIGTERENIGPS